MDKNKRKKIGKAGQIFVHENFSIESMAKKYFETI